MAPIASTECGTAYENVLCALKSAPKANATGMSNSTGTASHVC